MCLGIDFFTFVIRVPGIFRITYIFLISASATPPHIRFDVVLNLITNPVDIELMSVRDGLG